MPFRPMVVIAVVAMSMLVQSVSARTYPTKPIHLIVPYPRAVVSPASHLVQILLPTAHNTGALRRTPAGIDGQVRWRDKLRPRAR